MFFTLTYQPGFFAKCDYIETAKEKLPQKYGKNVFIARSIRTATKLLL